ncbi:hypothetical protein JD969_14420 [Planctomycetota bacterium]|nr:hypothetical protein JD969_14420 [Planctomycetota bacterium]
MPVCKKKVTVILGLLGCVVSGGEVMGEVESRTVALTREKAPGTRAVWSGFENFTINNAGQTGFKGFLTGTGVVDSNDVGIWLEDGGIRNFVIREGDGASEVDDGAYHRNFDIPRINSEGQVVFSGELVGENVDAGNKRGLWRYREGLGINMVARKGYPSGGAIVNTGSISYARVNDAGQFTYRTIQYADNFETDAFAIMRVQNMEQHVIVDNGDHATGLGDGVVLKSSAYIPSINNFGELGFIAQMEGPGITSENHYGIWFGDTNGRKLITRQGFAANGTDQKYDAFGTISVNDAGQVAFNASLKPMPGQEWNPGTDRGLWTGTSDLLHMVMRTGDDAADLNGLQYGQTLSFVMNTDGDVLFSSWLQFDGVELNNEKGMWMYSDGESELVAVTGRSLPGLEEWETVDYIHSMNMNDLGQAVFTTTVEGAGVTDDNDRVLWLRNADGELHKLLREGELFDVDDSEMGEELLTISDIDLYGYSGGEDGGAQSLNDLGELAVHLKFDGGTEGLFVLDTISTIPEPGTVGLCAAGLVGLLIGRKKHA